MKALPEPSDIEGAATLYRDALVEGMPAQELRDAAHMLVMQQEDPTALLAAFSRVDAELRREPEWARLKALGAEMHALIDAGKLDRASFERITDAALEASHGFTEVLEAFYNFRLEIVRDVEPEWDRLKALDAEMHALLDAGKLDRAAFNRILDEAEPLAHGFGEALESFYLFEPHPRGA